MALSILMPTFNGAEFLPEQLASFAAQSQPPARLIVSDDGSRDDTCEIVGRFAREAAFEVELRRGPRRGLGANTLALLARAGPHESVAFSDQDDLWLPERLARAADALAQETAATPVLYTAQRLVVDQHLRLANSLANPPARPSFANALVQNIAPAHTLALNPAALALAQAAALDCTTPPLWPDWWLYQLISGAGGRVIVDPEPVLYYRQHGRNLFGANAGARARLWRLRQLFDGTYRGWCAAQMQRLDASRARLTPEARTLLDATRQGARPRALCRQGSLDQAALRLAFLLGRA